MFGKSFQDEVNAAVDKVRTMVPGSQISATVAGKVVTLSGQAPDMNAKSRIMEEFNRLVKTENTVNQISIPKGAAAGASTPAFTGPAIAAASKAAGGTAAGGPRVHKVEKGDTLSAISKKYYGNANKYMKIFEANRDVLTDPDKIKPGQQLTIPD